MGAVKVARTVDVLEHDLGVHTRPDA